MEKYSKAIVAVGTAVVAVAATLGFNLDPTVVTAVEGAITALLVYVVPNK